MTIGTQTCEYSIMTKEKNNQLLQEHEAWKRSLDFYKQENAMLKYRLSEIVDKSEGEYFLQTAEYFHNEFLLKDEWMVRLSHRLQSVPEVLHITPRSVYTEDKSLFLQNELRQEIWQFERDFIQLSNEFNQKILTAIL